MKLTGGLLCLLGAGMASGAMALLAHAEKDSDNKTNTAQVQTGLPPSEEPAPAAEQSVRPAKKAPPAQSRGDHCPACGRG